MNYPALVRIGERLEHVTHDANRLRNGELPALLEPGAQRLTFDERHRIVRDAGRDPGRQHRHYVRVLQLGDELNLPTETLHVDLRGELSGQDLDDDFSPERGLFGEEHARHPSAAELALDHICVTKAFFERAAKVGRARLQNGRESN